MKRLIIHTILFVIAIFFSITNVLAQRGMSYQAVATNWEGIAVGNQTIAIEITLYKDSPTGSIIWQEIHSQTTNEHGYFSIVIGMGASTGVGSMLSFDKIDWANGKYFMRTRVDFGASEVGNGLLDMGRVQLLYVPYAFLADRAQFADSAGNANTANFATVADSARNVATSSFALNDLTDVNVSTASNNQYLMWDGTNWTSANIATPEGFLKQDGSTDLTGNWLISTNNITLKDGNMSLINGGLNLLNGSIALTNGDLNMSKGLLTANSLKLSLGTSINTIATTIAADPAPGSNDIIATEAAIKAYVESKSLGGGSSNWTLQNNNLSPVDLSYDVGIGIIPTTKFHVKLIDDEGFLVQGTVGSGNMPSLGGGTKMFFYPIKAAFRAGGLEATNSDWWDDINVGKYSAAFGKDTKASRPYAVAMGNGNQSTGQGAFSMGNYNLASGINSAAIGDGNTAAGTNAITLGAKNVAEGDNSMCIGVENATGKQAGVGALVGGYKSAANGEYSLVFGNTAKSGSTGDMSVSLGSNTYTNGTYSTAIGQNLTTMSVAEFVVGMNNKYYIPSQSDSYLKWYAEDRIFVVGNGQAADLSLRSNAMVIWKSGKVGIGYESYAALGNNLFAVSGEILASAVNTSSDIRFKKNILPLQNSLQNVLLMQGVWFDWRTDEFKDRNFQKTTDIGLIAQEVEKIYPELVDTDGNGYKSIDYAKLTAVLIEAIKEQQQLIVDLQTQNATYKTEIETLHKGLDALNAKIETIEQLIRASSQNK